MDLAFAAEQYAQAQAVAAVAAQYYANAANAAAMNAAAMNAAAEHQGHQVLHEGRHEKSPDINRVKVVLTASHRRRAWRTVQNG